MWSARRRLQARNADPGWTGTAARAKTVSASAAAGNSSGCWCLTESGGSFTGLAHAQLPGDGERVDGGAGAGDGAEGFVDLAARAGGEGAGWQPFHDLLAFAGVLDQAGEDLCLSPCF